MTVTVSGLCPNTWSPTSFPFVCVISIIHTIGLVVCQVERTRDLFCLIHSITETRQAELYLAGLVTYPLELLEPCWKGQCEHNVSKPAQYGLGWPYSVIGNHARFTVPETRQFYCRLFGVSVSPSYCCFITNRRAPFREMTVPLIEWKFVFCSVLFLLLLLFIFSMFLWPFTFCWCYFLPLLPPGNTTSLFEPLSGSDLLWVKETRVPSYPECSASVFSLSQPIVYCILCCMLPV